jgi:hypothetical protein
MERRSGKEVWQTGSADLRSKFGQGRFISLEFSEPDRPAAIGMDKLKGPSVGPCQLINLNLNRDATLMEASA